MTSGGGTASPDDADSYIPVDKLKKQYYDYLGAK